MTPLEFAQFALHRQRLALLGAVAGPGGTTQELVERLGLPAREVLEWLGTLAVEDLVAKDAQGRWQLLDVGLRSVAAQLPTPPPPAPQVLEGLTDVEQEVMARYASGRRLLEIPVNRSHRRVVLERLAMEFEPGQRYPEEEVNGILSLWYGDYALLRRALVDEGFLDRDAGEYWRAGGRVE